MLEIFSACLLLYLVGFGMMCWKVKEGGYVLLPEESGQGTWDASPSIKTYAAECFTHRFYWLLFRPTRSGP